MAAKKVRKSLKATAAAEAKLAKKAARHRGNGAVELVSRLSEAGDQPQLRTLSAGAIAAGLLLDRKRLARAGVRMLLAHELATAIKDVIKNRIDRTRPRSADNSRQAHPRPGSRTAKEHTSFPSGHTAGAVAVARAFAREFPEHRRAALGAAAFVGIAQVPRCAHYPTDVGAGAVIGVAAEALVSTLWSTVELDPEEQLTREAQRPPLPRV